MSRRGTIDRALPAALRATGNVTFVAYAAPFLLDRPVARRARWAYVGAHGVHLACLLATARRHRRGGGSLSSTSRFGGTLGYATIAALWATSYAPGDPDVEHAARRLHRVGEHVLFGLYGFTIVHGFLAKGRNGAVYGPLAALWLAAAAKARARWDDPRPRPSRGKRRVQPGRPL